MAGRDACRTGARHAGRWAARVWPGRVGTACNPSAQAPRALTHVQEFSIQSETEFPALGGGPTVAGANSECLAQLTASSCEAGCEHWRVPLRSHGPPQVLHHCTALSAPLGAPLQARQGSRLAPWAACRGQAQTAACASKLQVTPPPLPRLSRSADVLWAAMLACSTPHDLPACSFSCRAPTCSPACVPSQPPAPRR